MAGFAGVHPESPGWGVIPTVWASIRGLPSYCLLFMPPMHCDVVTTGQYSPGRAPNLELSWMQTLVMFLMSLRIVLVFFMVASHGPTLSCSLSVYVVLPDVVGHDMKCESLTHRDVTYLSHATFVIPFLRCMFLYFMASANEIFAMGLFSLFTVSQMYI